MNDSLSYRLPRIYLWLQEGSIKDIETADWRINAMTRGWESLALPFLNIDLPKACRLINLGMWVVAYHLLHEFARSAGAAAGRSKMIALALAMTPGFLLQAVSTANDFFICGLLLISVHFVLQHRREPGPVPVLASLLALVLATNVKPQFLLLGLGWLLWWAFGSGRPIKQVHWAILFALAPLYILVSPLPKLIDNFTSSGSITGGPQGGVPHPPMGVNALANSLQFGLSELQLPIMPRVSGFNDWLSALPGFSELHALVPKFSPGLSELPIIDNASFGFFSMMLIATGIFIGWKRSTSDSRWLLGIAGAAFLLAASQVTVSTLGRSFMGFVVLLFPLAMIGLAKMRSRLPLICVTISGLASLIINPSHPLWPCNTAEALAAKYGSPAISKKMEAYNSFRDRARTGDGILNGIPHGEAVGVLLREVTPIANLWQPEWEAHRIEFVHGRATDDFENSNIHWLVVGDKAVEQFPVAFKSYSELTSSWERVLTIRYLPTLQQGPEFWTLYHRSSP